MAHLQVFWGGLTASHVWKLNSPGIVEDWHLSGGKIPFGTPKNQNNVNPLPAKRLDAIWTAMAFFWNTSNFLPWKHQNHGHTLSIKSWKKKNTWRHTYHKIAVFIKSIPSKSTNPWSQSPQLPQENTPPSTLPPLPERALRKPTSFFTGGIAVGPETSGFRGVLKPPEKG